MTGIGFGACLWISNDSWLVYCPVGNEWHSCGREFRLSLGDGGWYRKLQRSRGMNSARNWDTVRIILQNWKNHRRDQRSFQWATHGGRFSIEFPDIHVNLTYSWDRYKFLHAEHLLDGKEKRGQIFCFRTFVNWTPDQLLGVSQEPWLNCNSN